MASLFTSRLELIPSAEKFLKAIESHWFFHCNLQHKPSAYYTSLTPKEYEFQVQCSRRHLDRLAKYYNLIVSQLFIN